MPIAQSNQNGRPVVADTIGQHHKERVAHQRNKHSGGGILLQASVAQGFGALQSGCNQSYRQNHEPCAGAGGDVHHLFAIDGEIIAQHTEAKAETHHIRCQCPPIKQEKAVERNGAVAGWDGALRQMQRGIYSEPNARYEHRQKENKVEIMGDLINENAHRRGYCHAQIVA